MRLLFIIHTYHRGKYLLLDLPSLIINKNLNLSDSDKTTLVKHLIGNASNEALADIFSKKNSLNFNKVFDINIENHRYISYPIFLDVQNYLNLKSSKAGNDGLEEDNQSGDEEENKKKIRDREERNKMVKLKMFNIVLEIERGSALLKNSNIIYSVLESVSYYLAFEEYRVNFLGHEIHLILRSYEKLENLSEIAKQDIHTLTSKFDLFMKSLNETQLFKILRKFYDDIKNLNYMKIPLNNWFEIRLPTKIVDSSIVVQNHQTILLTKKKQLHEMFMNNSDVNPLIKIFLDTVSPFKNFTEISLEFKLSLDFIKSIAKQIHCMSLGYVCNKFNNNTILTVNPNLKIKTKIDLEIENQFKLRNLYKFVNKFIMLKPLNKIFKKNSKDYTNDNFLNLIEQLITNEYLIPCSKYIIPKVALKKKYNQFSEYVNKTNCFFKNKENYNCIINDFDAKTEIDIKINESDFDSSKGNKFYFEDILDKIKKSSESDFNVLNDIYCFLNTEFDFDQIVNLSIYKDDLINSTIKKYKYLFNIIIEPVVI